MSLTADDRKYLDAKFEGLATKEDLHKHALEDKDDFRKLATAISVAVQIHEEKKHNIGKFFALLASIVVVGGSIIAAIVWLAQHGKP